MTNVLIGGFSHESNTFADEPTNRDHFRQRGEYFGEEIFDELRGTNTAIGGAIDAAEAGSVNLLPTVSASAQPGGVVRADAYDYYTRQIAEGASEHASDLDGVFLALHGAMVPEGMTDGEGPLLARVRDVVGDDVPIVATFDPHGNVSEEMVTHADALVAFETYPHVDMAEAGATAMELLRQFIADDADPVMAVERPPVLAQGPLQNTREGPMTAVVDRARELEERDSILKVNVFFGYHKADIPQMGFSIPVVADGDPDAAREAARDLAAFVWERREEFVGDNPDASEAVAEAKRLVADKDTDDGPVVLADGGDNPGGGAAADGTVLLRELLDSSVENAGFALVRDPEAVARCIDAGVGERVAVTIGAKTDDRHGEPIENVDGYVKAITDGRYVNTGPMSTGTQNNLGRTVRLECGAEEGVSVILTENRLQPFDAEIWRHVGVQPEEFDVLAVKSQNHFRADYEPMASSVIVVDTPGLSAIDVSRLGHQHISRPQFPLDDMSDEAYPDWN